MRNRSSRLCLLAAAACLGDPASAESCAPDNKQVVRDFIRTVFEQRDLAAADRYLAADYVQHNCKVEPGLDGFKRSMTAWFTSIPPMHETILHLVADGDLVVAHNRLTFTKGERSQSVEGFDLYRLAGGKIVEHWDSDSTTDCSKQK